MATIKCGAVDCKHNADDNKCMELIISLEDCYCHTAHEGFQHFWRCKNYEQCEWSKKMKKIFEKNARGDSNEAG